MDKFKLPVIVFNNNIPPREDLLSNDVIFVEEWSKQALVKAVIDNKFMTLEQLTTISDDWGFSPLQSLIIVSSYGIIMETYESESSEINFLLVDEKQRHLFSEVATQGSRVFNTNDDINSYIAQLHSYEKVAKPMDSIKLYGLRSPFKITTAHAFTQTGLVHTKGSAIVKRIYVDLGNVSQYAKEKADRYVIAIADLNAYDPNTIRFNSFEIPVEFREFLILTNANPDSIPGSELHIISLDVGAVLQYTSDLPFEMYFDTTFVVTEDTAI